MKTKMMKVLWRAYSCAESPQFINAILAAALMGVELGIVDQSTYAFFAILAHSQLALKN